MKGIVSARETGAIFRQAEEDYDTTGHMMPDVEKTAALPKPRYVLLPHWDPHLSAEIMHDHADEMGYPHRRMATPVADQGLVDMGKAGGFTLHDHVGDGPTSGYMVSQHKNTEYKLPIETLTPKLINDYVGQHTNALSQPHNYLGGWLDGKDFYLDVSTHRPTIDRATHDATQADQLAIYDLNHGTSINTPDAAWQAGDPGLGAKDRPKNPFLSSMPPEEHDWTSHDLGDPGDEQLYAPERHRMAADTPFGMPGLQNKGEAPGSTHGAIIQNNPKTGENWLVKPDKLGGGALAKLDVAANHIAGQSGLDTPATFEGSHQGVPASAQLMVPGAKNPFAKAINPEDPNISDDDLLTIQKHHALDWMIGNHDGHGGQFIRDQGGKLIGIDKAQAFKFANNDRLHWDFHPNGAMYGESEPIANTLYRNFAKGGREIGDPREGELGKYAQGLQSIPDDEYADTLRPYAETAAQNGILGKDFGVVPDVKWGKAKFKPNDVEGFLKHAVDRKNNLMNDLGSLYDRARAHRMTGTKIAKVPDRTAMVYMGQCLGSHGARVYSEPSGEWLIKRPPRGADFMAHLDKAASCLQMASGLFSPETHTLDWDNGRQATAVRMISGAQQAYESPPRLADLHPRDLMTLQKHQALDWLMGNHDSHVGNFMRSASGDLVGIDKGQSAKYYGRDRLANDFHPNFYAREPVYNQLWRDHVAGKGRMNDPRTGELSRYIANLQGISDDHLKHIFRPYAESAAEAGLLANVNDDGEGSTHPDRRLGEPTIPPNDPEAFLEAMAKRKKSLKRDLAAFYDRQDNERKTALPETGMHVML